MDRWVTPPKRVTSPTWGTRLPCKQALSFVANKDWLYKQNEQVSNDTFPLTSLMFIRKTLFHSNTSDMVRTTSDKQGLFKDFSRTNHSFQGLRLIQ